MIKGQIIYSALTDAITDISNWIRNWASRVRQIGDGSSERLVNRLRDASPQRTGKVSRGWVRLPSGKSVRVGSPEAVSFLIANEAPHWKYVKEGTGIYGPLNRLILPKKGIVLVFEKEGRTVFTRWSRGLRPRQTQIDKIDWEAEDGERVNREAEEEFRKLERPGSGS